MVFGGECSYSIYLLHPFLIRLAMIGKSDMPALPEFLFRLCLFVAIVTAVGCGDLCVHRSAVAGMDQACIRPRAPREILRAHMSCRLKTLLLDCWPGEHLYPLGKHGPSPQGAATEYEMPIDAELHQGRAEISRRPDHTLLLARSSRARSFGDIAVLVCDSSCPQR